MRAGRRARSQWSGEVFVGTTDTRPDDEGILARLHVAPNSNWPFG